MSDYLILKTTASASYELIDSGDGEKLERYGQIKVRRPDPQALWKKHVPKGDWDNADASYVRAVEKGSWSTKPGLPAEWSISLDAFTFFIKLSAFKHTGIFPEQFQNWKWIDEKVKKAGRKIKVLNLFGYTGGASIAAALAGAEVTHVDGSKSAVTWAHKNATASGVSEDSVRWIVDDVRAFVKREIKRGEKYDAIIMDPPNFGRGAKGEVWKIENHFLTLLDSCKEILSELPQFVLINGYAAGYSALGYENALKGMMSSFKGNTEVGEVVLVESQSKRILPSGIFARWFTM
ncbi:MAG: hypothetical protein RJA61_346 [Candidatus Parcubacteria bacterium]|jgi:23S rRNA (cytosine1962-C5)-methyltransferase